MPLPHAPADAGESVLGTLAAAATAAPRQQPASARCPGTSEANAWARRCVTSQEWATIASGSYPVSGMIVIPCSAGTLGAIANGISRDLLQRAADVTLKERRPLVLAFRESPYSLVHIENMRRAALAGAIIAPPSPAFYVARPSVEKFLDAYCGRAARLLGLDVPGEEFRWKGTAEE